MSNKEYEQKLLNVYSNINKCHPLSNKYSKDDLLADVEDDDSEEPSLLSKRSGKEQTEAGKQPKGKTLLKS